MLEEFDSMRHRMPDTFCKALLNKENMSVTDIIKINRAISQLYK